jgi:cell division protein FtsQ
MSPRTSRSKTSGRKTRTKAVRGTQLRRWVRWGLVVLACTAMGALGYAFQRYLNETRYLYVKTIRIQGNSADFDQDVLERSGITQNDHILMLDPAEAAKRVETLPFVRRCRVTRIFPDTVVIAVEQREPVAVLSSNGRFFAIDREGVPLEERPNTAPLAGVFISEVPGLEVVTLGEPIHAPALHKALEVLQAFGQTRMAADVRVSELAARHPNDIRMYCDQLEFEIRWGRDGLEDQARRLDLLWAYEEGQPSFDDYCDLRFGMNVACR